MGERSRTGITRLKPVGRLLEVETAAEGLLEKGKGPGIREKDDVAGTRTISSTASSLVKFALNRGNVRRECFERRTRFNPRERRSVERR